MKPPELSSTALERTTTPSNQFLDSIFRLCRAYGLLRDGGFSFEV